MLTLWTANNYHTARVPLTTDITRTALSRYVLQTRITIACGNFDEGANETTSGTFIWTMDNVGNTG